MKARTNLKIWSVVIAFVLITAAPSFAGKTIYVDDDASGANDGSSWADAYNYLQDALTAAWSGDEIRVARGIYKPDQGAGVTPRDREATFQLINGVTIKGGYAGTGAPDPDARDIELYETILSGDIKGDDKPNFVKNDDNSYHVVTVSAPDVVVDGLTIVGGNANRGKGGPISEYPHAYGGGIFCGDDATLVDVTFAQNFANYGGGLCCGPFPDVSNPTLIGCILTGNRADVDGGAIWIGDSIPTLINCRILSNSAVGCGGGVMFGNDNDTLMVGCYISGNSAGTDGGGIYAEWFSGTFFTNCTVTGNSADGRGGGLYFDDDQGFFVTNSVFWDNTDTSGTGQMAQFHAYPTDYPLINYSCVQGWTGNLGGDGNFADDPMLLDAHGPDNVYGTEDDNPRLSAGSPCIDAGDPN
ncbi:MAG: right-handed parallel beta-helix repeat-containing protein, partial [Planctomycetota bacterium]